MARYSPLVRELFDRPLPDAGGEATGEAGSREQGTWIRFGVDVIDGKIANPGFRALACPHIIAACHRVLDALDGATPGVFSELACAELQQELEIPVEKAGKLLILKDALLACQQAAEVLPETSGHD